MANENEKINKLKEIVSMATPFMTPKDVVIAHGVIMLIEGYVEINKDFNLKNFSKELKLRRRIKKYFGGNNENLLNKD